MTGAPDLPDPGDLADAAALRRRAAELEGATAEEILAFAFATWERIALSTAFGAEGCALVHMAARLRPGVSVFTVDTGFLFPETIALRDRIAERYPVQLSVLTGSVSLGEQEQLHGARLYERDTDRCCALRKVEPSERALSGLDAWVTGLRRDQSRSRAGIEILESYPRPEGAPLVKVNPLARWTRADTWRYLLEHDVPYNPLLDRGYRSIGCWPCTRPVGEGEEERAGRWDGQKEECGVHTFLGPRR